MPATKPKTPRYPSDLITASVKLYETWWRKYANNPDVVAGWVLYNEARDAWHRTGELLDRIRDANRYAEMPFIHLRRGSRDPEYAVYCTEAEIREIARALPLSAQEARWTGLLAMIRASVDEEGRMLPDCPPPDSGGRG